MSIKVLHPEFFHDALTLYKTYDVFKIRNSLLVLPSQLGDKREIRFSDIWCDLYVSVQILWNLTALPFELLFKPIKHE